VEALTNITSTSTKLCNSNALALAGSQHHAMVIPIIANIPAIPTTPYIPDLASILNESIIELEISYRATVYRDTSITSKANDRKMVENKYEKSMIIIFHNGKLGLEYCGHLKCLETKIIAQITMLKECMFTMSSIQLAQNPRKMHSFCVKADPTRQE
jgi:hypothetical protein